MAEPLSSNFWISQFVLRLMELRRGLNIVEAVQYAVYQYPYARGLEPESAAAIFSAGHPQLESQAVAQPAVHGARITGSAVGAPE